MNAKNRLLESDMTSKRRFSKFCRNFRQSNIDDAGVFLEPVLVADSGSQRMSESDYPDSQASDILFLLSFRWSVTVPRLHQTDQVPVDRDVVDNGQTFQGQHPDSLFQSSVSPSQIGNSAGFPPSPATPCNLPSCTSCFFHFMSEFLTTEKRHSSMMLFAILGAMRTLLHAVLTAIWLK